MASLLSPARVGVVLAYTPPEEALAAITAGCTIVFPSGFICADGAQRGRGLGLSSCSYEGRLGPQRLCGRKWVNNEMM